MRYFERRLSNRLKKVNFTFSLEPSAFNRQSHQKQKWHGTSDQSLFKPIHDIINYSTSICPFESGKCEKEGKKQQKLEYLGNEKSFFNKIKKSFHSF